MNEIKNRLAENAAPAKAVEPSTANDPSQANQASPPPQPSATQPANPQEATARQLTSGSAPGAQADKESDATSIIDVPPEKWRLGKPLAAHGLELKPRRPTIDVLTMLTAAPGNPLCQINFGRSGEPKAAAILRGSGDSRVDDAILASLYRWRASGKELDGLSNDQTIEVRIHMLLNRSRLE